MKLSRLFALFSLAAQRAISRPLRQANSQRMILLFLLRYLLSLLCCYNICFGCDQQGVGLCWFLFTKKRGKNRKTKSFRKILV